MMLAENESIRLLKIIAGLLDKQEDRLAKIEDILNAEYSWNDPPAQLGTTFTLHVHPQGGGPIVKIDLVRGENDNVPPTDSIAVPGTPVSTLIVYNEGSAQIGFSTNKPRNSTETNVVLTQGDVFKIAAVRPAITRLHIVAPFNDAHVRVLMIV